MPVTNDPAPPPQSGEPAKPAEPTGADALAALARTEQRMVRLTFWQTLLSVAGALIAILALFATLRESEEVRRQTAAAVWPYIQVQMDDFDLGDTASLSLSFTNTGVGPAKVRSLRLEVDGQPVADWDALLARLEQPADSPYGRDSVSQRVLAPGESVTLFTTRHPPLVRALQAAIRRPGTVLGMCYCSIFDECWQARSGPEPEDPRPVAACPSHGPDQFQG